MEAGDGRGDDAQRRVIGHRRGPLLVTGRAGSGRTESLVRRFASLAEDGVRAERILVSCRTRAGAATLRDRVEAGLAHAHEEPWIGTHAELAERILREYPTEAGLDPFFTTVTAADRLAILLDRVDDLPLRRHEIRGNPAGLLARLLRRIDLLKHECVTPEALRDWATQRDRDAKRPAQRERARREVEFAELYARHDRMIAEAGSLDEGDLLIEAERLARDRPDIADELHARFEHVMVDELEEAAPAHMRFIAGLVSSERANIVAAHDSEGAIRRFRGAGEGSLEWFRRAYPAAEEVELVGRHRFGEAVGAVVGALTSRPGEAMPPGSGTVRFWRCEGERAQAQA
ncbi:MAG: UvrD-helicase domain-containing protein, partial [Actinomycetota bacterium]|nr:UvrD-helicase domain-containing protein [Actinomycetota bacterium]